MGIEHFLIAVAIIMVGFPIAVTFGGDYIEDTRRNADSISDAKTFGNNAQGGDIVCGLEVEVRGELDLSRKWDPATRWFVETFYPIGETLYIYMGEGTFFPQGAVARWAEGTCYQLDKSSFGSLFAITRNFADDIGSLQTAVVVTAGNSFDVELTGKSLTTGKPLTEQGKYKEWVNEVKIKDFAIQELPITWKTIYYLQDVKVDDYELYIRVKDNPINDQDTNRPFVVKVHRPVFGD